MLPWKQLSTFCMAARHASFKLAANELCLTPSAVSHQLRDLEAYLGVSLFERQTRKIALTPAGRSLFRQIENKIVGIEQAVNGLRAQPCGGLVHIKVPEFFASELLIPRVASFSDQHRHIELRIETTRSGSTSAPTADLAIVLSRKSPQLAEVHKLFPVRFVPACAPQAYAELLEGADQSPQQCKARINHTTLLVHESRPDSWQEWAHAAGLGVINPQQIIRLDSMLSLVRATEQGLGVGLLPMPLCRHAFEAGRVKRLSQTDYVTSDYYYLAAPRGGGMASQKLAQWILQTFTNLK